jgi:hypothetical protein
MSLPTGAIVAVQYAVVHHSPDTKTTDASPAPKRKLATTPLQRRGGQGEYRARDELLELQRRNLRRGSLVPGRIRRVRGPMRRVRNRKRRVRGSIRRITVSRWNPVDVREPGTIPQTWRRVWLESVPSAVRLEALRRAGMLVGHSLRPPRLLGLAVPNVHSTRWSCRRWTQSVAASSPARPHEQCATFSRVRSDADPSGNPRLSLSRAAVH